MKPLPQLLPDLPEDICTAISAEYVRAQKWGGKFASLHEAYAVMAEELDEVWQIVLQKKFDRDPAKLHKELVQVAAMAVKAIFSMENLHGIEPEQKPDDLLPKVTAELANMRARYVNLLQQCLMHPDSIKAVTATADDLLAQAHGEQKGDHHEKL